MLDVIELRTQLQNAGKNVDIPKHMLTSMGTASGICKFRLD